MPGYMRVKNIIYSKFGKEPWYNHILSYIIQRYFSIEDRMIETFRYVHCHPNNQKTFSYEYASILRDSGSVFSSVVDRLVKETSSVSRRLNIKDYLNWLRQEVENIHLIAAEINYPLPCTLLVPFNTLKDGNIPKWWTAYNHVKHMEIDKIHEGNFENALNSVAALAILLALMEPGGIKIKLFPYIGFFYPKEYMESLLFFKGASC